MRKKVVVATLVGGLAVSLSGCFNANDFAMQIGRPSDSAVKLRQIETRRFDTLDETRLLSAATQTLQDLGFTIAESSVEVGVVTGSKQRDAEEAGQVAGQVALMILAALGGRAHNPVWDKEQTIRVTLVTLPVENSKQVEIRCTFDREITNNQGVKWRAELVEDPEIYNQFFDKLAQSVFLEAHKI